MVFVGFEIAKGGEAELVLITIEQKVSRQSWRFDGLLILMDAKDDQHLSFFGKACVWNTRIATEQAQKSTEKQTHSKE